MRSKEVPNIHLTTRDRDIIRFVHQHRLLRSTHIVALIGGSPQPILRRLQLLFHHGYLERPIAQIEYYHKGGSRPMVYGLGNKAHEVFKGVPGFSRNWNAKNRNLRRVFLEHALFVSDVMVTLQLACRNYGNVRLLTGADLLAGKRSDGRDTFKWRVSINKRIKLGVIPDRVFALEHVDRNGKSNRAFFFLEGDRGTMPVVRRNLAQTSIYRKLLAYHATWQQSIHRTRFGFNRFRVLIVTKSTERAASLAEATSRLKSGHGLFLCTDWPSLQKSTSIFSHEWHTGRSLEAATLLS